MTDTAISTFDLSKRYRIGEREPYKTLRDTIAQRLRPGKGRAKPDEVWAVRDVSFEMERGEVVGIIGRNGAGKTTLLKILSRITKPTTGRAYLAGSVGSLLEVGTGFHPELSGRENVFMSGAILGMKKAEIERKFDDIVAFAGVSRFIDTPVKRFSSGMQLRLAFSVAAFLEPDVLLVDEVLAVGDAEFQKRCMGRMEEVSAEGRAVIFVSHNMPAVLRICPRVIYMKDGAIAADGRSQEVVRAYLDTGHGTTAERMWASPEEAPGDDTVRLKAVRVRSQGGVSDELDIRRPLDIEVEYWLLSASELRPAVALRFINEEGVVLFLSSEFSYPDIVKRPRQPGVTRAVCRIPGNFFAEGQIFVDAIVTSTRGTAAHVYENEAVAFHVVDSHAGDSVRGDLVREWPGAVRPLFEWDVQDEPWDEQGLTG